MKTQSVVETLVFCSVISQQLGILWWHYNWSSRSWESHFKCTDLSQNRIKWHISAIAHKCFGFLVTGTVVISWIMANINSCKVKFQEVSNATGNVGYIQGTTLHNQVQPLPDLQPSHLQPTEVTKTSLRRFQFKVIKISFHTTFQIIHTKCYHNTHYWNNRKTNYFIPPLTTGGCMLHLISYCWLMTRCSEHVPYINREVSLVYLINSACVYLFTRVLYCAWVLYDKVCLLTFMLQRHLGTDAFLGIGFWHGVPFHQSLQLQVFLAASIMPMPHYNTDNLQQ